MYESNPIINGNGASKIISRYPPVLLLAFPIKENPILANLAAVEMALSEVRIMYPRVSLFEVSLEQTDEFGEVLQLIVR